MKFRKPLSLLTGAALLLCSSVALANRLADVRVNATPIKDS
jgi:cyclase